MYEKMKNHFLLELEMALPGMSAEQIGRICMALDRAAMGYDVKLRETALAVVEDAVPALLKTYIVVKKTEGLADGSLQNYYQLIRLFFLWYRRAPEEVTANDIRMFLFEYQQMRKVSDRTLDKYREVICAFFHWAHAEEYISRDPGRAVKPIKCEIKERQALTQVELEYLRLACRTLRDKAMIEFMYSTGCRVSEMIAVRKSDVDFKGNTVHLIGKGKKHRTSFINAKCEVALGEYLKSRNDTSEYLFVSERAPHDRLKKCAVERVLRKLSDESQLGKRITPHILRHTTATQAVNNGMKIEEVSKLLGHASVATTMIYAKVSRDNVQTQHTKCVI